ncbi:MAG: hypothetical protein WCX71_04845 [Candidatus Buchananbacteria bacterium]
MNQITTDMLKSCVVSLRTGLLEWSVALAVAEQIKAAVAAGIATWEELSTSKAETYTWLRTAQLASLKRLSEKFFLDRIDFMSYPYVAEQIKAAVAAGIATWDDLGVTEAQIDNQVRRYVMRDMRSRCYLLRIGRYYLRETQAVVEQIKAAVAAGIATWEELEANERDLDLWVENIRQMEKGSCPNI